MFNIKPRYIHLNCQSYSLFSQKCYSNNSNLEKFKTKLNDGPELQDFIAGVVPRGNNWDNYDGKLKRGKGDNER